MRSLLCLVLLAIMALPGVLHAAGLPALGMGAWFQVTGPKSVPLTAAGESPNASPDFNIGWIKMIQYSSDPASSWCLVEFDRIDIPRDDHGNVDHRGQVTITKDRMWLNFSQLTSVQTMDPPDYNKLMAKFAGGVKVVPYTAP